MSALLFKLRNVPEEEANDIRELMAQHNIEIYETSAGNWGISMPALWVKNDSELEHAKKLLADYQKQRQVSARHQYEANRAAGNTESFAQKFMKRPLAHTGIILFCLFVLYAMIAPFVRLALHR